ncbi:MAG: type II secretion system protein [Candidatus Moraniibacteriota bacterium]
MKKSKNNKGFTLLELTFSVVLFTIIIGGMVLFGVRVIQNHQRSQAMQQALENARFAIESLNKTIRTSNNISVSVSDFNKSDEIFIKDNVENKSYCYEFSGNRLQRKEATTSTEINSCSDITSAFYELVGSSQVNVGGGFFVKDTDIPGGERGIVRTVIELSYESPIENSPYGQSGDLLLQSAVSLRDYSFNFN